ncbi:hypothetical protein CBR_g32189 [Chara braunii]|uniref:RNA-directed DNA polymerase n=1 Tax=Chara braunii TaxID=69332 RepID=A0A388JN49_CHABU|nr:hypothetical protein CBR_g32189 [Chara braunii]|eukprot:GBG59173.1 hypothetical protein CBR_g32189 [Chara braunii]
MGMSLPVPLDENVDVQRLDEEFAGIQHAATAIAEHEKDILRSEISWLERRIDVHSQVDVAQWRCRALVAEYEVKSFVANTDVTGDLAAISASLFYVVSPHLLLEMSRGMCEALVLNIQWVGRDLLRRVQHAQSRAALQFAVANNELLPLVRTLNLSLQIKDAELAQVRDRGLLTLPGNRHADFELDLRRSQTRELLMLCELFCGILHNLAPVAERGTVAALHDQIRSLSVRNAELEIGMAELTVVLASRVDRRLVRVPKPLPYCPPDIAVDHVGADGRLMSMCMKDRPRVVRSATEVEVLLSAEANRMDMLGLDPDSPASVPPPSESRFEPPSSDELEDEITDRLHFQAAHWRGSLPTMEGPVPQPVHGSAFGAWPYRDVNYDVHFYPLQSKSPSDFEMRQVSGHEYRDADGLRWSLDELLHLLYIKQQEIDFLQRALADQQRVHDEQLVSLLQKVKMSRKEVVQILGDNHSGKKAFDRCDLESTIRQLQWVGETLLYRLVQAEVQAALKFVVTEPQALCTIEVLYSLLTAARREFEEFLATTFVQQTPAGTYDITVQQASDIHRSARDPYSIRNDAELNEELCRQRIADRESKLARLLGRGFQEGDPKLERVRDQIEEAKEERQRYQDKVNEMQAIIDSGHINDDADYRSEREMLSEGDTDTSSSIPSEEIVTDYAHVLSAPLPLALTKLSWICTWFFTKVAVQLPSPRPQLPHFDLFHYSRLRNSRLQQLQQRPVATPDASSSNTSDHLNALEVDIRALKDSVQLQQTATQQLEQRICAAATNPSSASRETTPKFDGQEIFCDSMKTDPIPRFRKFELKLQLHHVSKDKKHAYLYSRSGGACQAWLDNLLSKYGVVAADLYTKISWDDLKAAWHKRFQVELPEIKAMDKLLTFEQGTLPSVDWIAKQRQIGKLSTVGSESTALSTPSKPVAPRVTALRSKAHAEVNSPLLPMLGTHAQGQDVCAASSPSGSDDLSSSSGSSWDSAREFNIEVLDLLTSEDFAWLPLPTTGCLSGPQCVALCAHLHMYLSFYAPPTSPKDDEAAVGDILAYVTKVAREFRKQQYDDNNAPLLYVRIQVGQASCNALLDSGPSRNFMSQAFMQRVGLGAQVRRKANPTAIKLADGRTQQLIDRYIEVVPVYFAPHACGLVTFDILDTDFNIILGMPWLASVDHTVNFHWRTLTVRHAFGAEVPCIIPLLHPSIPCQVVTAKSLRATCTYEQPDEIGLCFIRTVAIANSSPTDLSSDPRVVQLLDEFANIFESPTGVVPDRPIPHKIILEAGVVPPKGCIYHMSEEELTVLRARLDDLLDKGWIRPSSSPYGASVLFVREKNKDLRLCIDYRKLNAQTVKNVGPLPRFDDLLERLCGAKYFSKLDLKSGYHQISIQSIDRYKSTFKTRYWHFEWVVMPFGLTNAPTTFQATMTNEFPAMLDPFVLVYLDDILVYSRTLEDHLEHLRQVLETLCRDKCEFVQQELEYLGHFVTPKGISPSSDKIQAIQEWSEPRNVTDVRSFLDLADCYQRFIKGYSKIAAHLTKLQCEDRSFHFRDDARESFLALKAALLSAEVLRIYDSLLPTRVTTDASGYGIGVVLEQHDGKELLAFVHALKRSRHFLLGRSQFRWVTDNNPLVFYKTQDTVNSMIARSMAFIDQFDFFPDHISGKPNHFMDALSWRPDHCAAVYSTFEIDDDLRDSFIRDYQPDPEFLEKYANCSSPNPAPSHYQIQEGYLLVHTRGKDLFCVPSDSHLRTRLLGEFHDAPAIGHFGVNRTIGRLRKRFWWSGLLGDVTRYCESSEVCRRYKSRNHRPYGGLRPLPVPLRRREAIAMDITEPFPKHKTSVDGILTVVDRLTKFAMFLPCRYHDKAPKLAEVLYAGWIRTKGYPKEIVCDRDTRFMSYFWLALIKRWGSSLKPSSARHPQTDGQTERAHQTAQVLLHTLIRPDQKDWVERLPDVELAYNSSIHSAIGMSPFKFEHGSPITSPLDTIIPRAVESDDHLLFLRRLQELLVKARDQMAKTQQRMSQQANRQRLPCPFRVGDLVWVSAAEFSLEQDISLKLLPK